MLYNRTRVNEETEVIGAHSAYHGGPAYKTRSCVTSRLREEMQDNLTPNFMSRKKRGEIINNPCLMTVDHQEVRGNGNDYIYQNSNPSNVYEVYGDGSVTQWFLDEAQGELDLGTPIDTSNMMQILRSEAVANIDWTPYAFLEDVGETRETLRFLRNPFISIFRLGKLFRKDVLRNMLKNGRTVKTFAQSASEIWLTYRFAVMPLVRSIVTLLEAQSTDVSYRPERQTARSIEPLEKVRASGSQAIQWWNSNTQTYVVNCRETIDLRLGILYEIDNPVADIWYKYGLRVKDIPETAWNLLPLSFMVDRFINISNSVRGLTNLSDPNVDILTGWIVTKREFVLEYTLTALNESGYTHIVTPDTVYRREFTYQREVWEPGLQDTIPGFTPHELINSATKLTDLITLSIALFTKKG